MAGRAKVVFNSKSKGRSAKAVLTMPSVKEMNVIKKDIYAEQTEKVKAYARLILNEAKSTAEFNDQTKNLADSYVAVVYFNGARKATIYLTAAPQATKELTMTGGGTFNGRKAAQQFANEYVPRNKKGWEVVFAATAYYAAYLEYGVVGGVHGQRAEGYMVMTQMLDDVIRAFGASNTFALPVEFYTYTPEGY